ncbi:ComF family protein [Domibacillus tundrae]|uniref:ComF family protein n=1 Tax=Domibacillus tundrae TaxID=1587527 RepID=UPI000696E2FD|nr:ComF family protein [Domibacillus tundrae]
MSQCLLCENDTAVQSWRGFFGAKAPVLCNICLNQFEKIDGPTCEVCSRPMDQKGICPDCAAWEKNIFISNQSLYHYNEAMKALIARFKYRGDYALAEMFAEDVRAMAKKAACDLVCAVPLPPSRLAERRFNQSEALIEMAGLPHTPLLARHESDKQSKKSRAERIEAEQTFYPIGNAAGKSILVIDDIYTTGATIRLVAEALGQAGAVSVKSITIARSGS